MDSKAQYGTVEMYSALFTLGVAQSGMKSKYRNGCLRIFMKYGPEYTHQVSGWLEKVHSIPSPPLPPKKMVVGFPAFWLLGGQRFVNSS